MERGTVVYESALSRRNDATQGWSLDQERRVDSACLLARLCYCLPTKVFPCWAWLISQEASVQMWCLPVGGWGGGSVCEKGRKHPSLLYALREDPGARASEKFWRSGARNWMD